MPLEVLLENENGTAKDSAVVAQDFPISAYA
jgi:hypothetical protein